MCQICFDRHWDDRDLGAFLVSLATDVHRQAAIQRAYDLILPGCTCLGPFLFCSIPGLHAAINNDNYGFDWYQSEKYPVLDEWIMATQAWDLLSGDERSILVARLHKYEYSVDA